MANALGLTCKRLSHERGHAALLTLALAGERDGRRPLSSPTEADIDQVPQQVRIHDAHAGSGRARSLFDTNRPSGFSAASAPRGWRSSACFEDGLLNMTLLALRFSRYANGVAMQHGKVSRADVPAVPDRLDHQWRACADVGFGADAADARHAIPAWRRDNLCLRNAIDLPEQEMLNAHRRAKEALLTEVASRTGLVLESAMC